MATTDYLVRDNANYNNILEVLDAEREHTNRILTGLADSSDTNAFAEAKVRLRQMIEASQAEFFPHVTALGVTEAGLVTASESDQDDIETALADLETSITGPKITTLKTAVGTFFDTMREELYAAARNGLTDSQKHEIAINYFNTHNQSEEV